jgi:RecB family endonuclease NucS
LTRIADAVGVDLWVLDGLWWRYEKLLVNGEEESQEIEPGTQGESTRFGLERHLHEFLRDNWVQTELGRDWAIYEEDGDPDAGYEYPCKVGRIDLLARHRKEPRWLVIELKRNQSSDQTVGQLLRYMGWVKQHLAGDGEKVEGLVIAHQADDSIRYALAVAPDVELQLYEVDFRLRKTNVSPEGQT